MATPSKSDQRFRLVADGEGVEASDVERIEDAAGEAPGSASHAERGDAIQPHFFDGQAMRSQAVDIARRAGLSGELRKVDLETTVHGFRENAKEYRSWPLAQRLRFESALGMAQWDFDGSGKKPL